MTQQESNSTEIRPTNLMMKVNHHVLKERVRQNKKWGVQRHPIGTWLAILGEEFGEVCQAAQISLDLASVKTTDADNLYEECIHVAAVASAIAEQVAEQRSKNKEVA